MWRADVIHIQNMPYLRQSLSIRLFTVHLTKKFASSAIMGNNYIKRTTLFKVPNEEDIQMVLQQYEILRKNAVKVLRVLCNTIVHPPNDRSVQESSLRPWLTRTEQNGKPYIVSNVARRITNTSSPLSEGYTIMSQTLFSSQEDHEFYDKECPAHKQLKEVTGKARSGPSSVMTLVTEGEWPEPKL